MDEKLTEARARRDKLRAELTSRQNLGRPTGDLTERVWEAEAECNRLSFGVPGFVDHRRKPRRREEDT